LVWSVWFEAAATSSAALNRTGVRPFRLSQVAMVKLATIKAASCSAVMGVSMSERDAFGVAGEAGDDVPVIGEHGQTAEVTEKHGSGFSCVQSRDVALEDRERLRVLGDIVDVRREVPAAVEVVEDLAVIWAAAGDDAPADGGSGLDKSGAEGDGQILVFGLRAVKVGAAVLAVDPDAEGDNSSIFSHPHP